MVVVSSDRGVIFAKILVAAFVGEILILLTLAWIPIPLSVVQKGLLDALLVSILLSAMLWWTLAKPLKRLADIESTRFSQLVEAVPDGVIGVDAEGTIRIANERVETLFGYPREDLIDSPIDSLIPDESEYSQAGIWKAWISARRPGTTGSSIQTVGRRADGSELPIEICLNSAGIGDGQLAICTVRDVSDQRRAKDELLEANAKLSRGMRNLEQSADELRRLSELGELLQGCIAETEAHTIISRVMTRLLSGTTGGVYVLSASRNGLQLKSSWGNQVETLAPIIGLDDCWALRRGRMHTADDNQSTIQCMHINPMHQGYVCLPIMAQGDLVGLFHVFVPADASTQEDGESGGMLEAKRMLLVAISEQIGLALANLRLRDELTQLSIRDPLTGLFNRRFMEECFEREVLRVRQGRRQLALLMIDLDHFKKFNDMFGHEGGDLILREVGDVLRRQAASDGVACRVGGEELAIILPNVTTAEGAARAEAMRREIQNMAIVVGGKPLGKVTASMGIALYPTHGTDYHQTLKAADAALYRAKSEGRNKVVVADGKITALKDSSAPGRDVVGLDTG